MEPTDNPSTCLQFNQNPEQLSLYCDNAIQTPDMADVVLATVIGGLSFTLDAVIVGELSLESARDWGDSKINQFVQFAAEQGGFKGDSLKDAIAFLEKEHPMASDSLTPEFGGGLQHHLRDYNHHCSLAGLMFSLFTQFTGKVIGTDVNGALKIVPITDERCIGRNIGEKIYIGVVEWAMHLVSDMAGSSGANGRGTGIPGPLLSLLKELSAAKPFQNIRVGDNSVSQLVSKMFNGTLLAQRDENGRLIRDSLQPFDFRVEVGWLAHNLKRGVFLLINNALVFACCALRGLFDACRSNRIHTVSDVMKRDILFPEQIISRMITISTGVYDALDAARAVGLGFMRSSGTTVWERVLSGVIAAALNKNYAADAQLIAAIIADVKITAKTNAMKALAADQREQGLSGLFSPVFTFEQTRVIESLKKYVLEQDIAHTDDHNLNRRKSDWAAAYLSRYDEPFFLTEQELEEAVHNLPADATGALVLAEAFFFCPYFLVEGCDTKIDADNKIMRYYFRDHGWLTDWNATFSEWQWEAEEILTPEKSAAYRELYTEQAKNDAKKWLMGFKIGATFLSVIPFAFLLPENSFDGLAEGFSKGVLDHQLRGMKARETAFYYSCVKLMVLSHILDSAEKAILRDQLACVKTYLSDVAANCKEKEIKALSEHFTLYIERCESGLADDE